MKIKTKKAIICSCIVIAVAALIFIGTLTGGEEITTETVWLDSGRNTYVKAEIMLPENASDAAGEKLPLVTIGHGFRGDMDSAGGNYLSEALAKAGFAVIRMDYAQYPTKDADAAVNEYTVDTMIADQLTCIRYMTKHRNADPERIGLYGRSLGGRVAMTMANKNSGGYDYKALALVAPAGTEEALTYYMGGDDKWQEMKEEASQNGSVVHQGVTLTPDFFTGIESYAPADDINAFKNPVLVIYNTEDYVVLPETSKECAAAYEDVELVEVTSSESPHGYEMGFKSSRLKDELLGKITTFFEEALLQ